MFGYGFVKLVNILFWVLKTGCFETCFGWLMWDLGCKINNKRGDLCDVKDRNGDIGKQETEVGAILL